MLEINEKIYLSESTIINKFYSVFCFECLVAIQISLPSVLNPC